MIRARKLGHAALKVRDLAKSKEFYMRTLGLQVANENLTPPAVFLSFGREHHELALFELAISEGPLVAQPGLHHTAWQLGSLEELQAAHEQLKAMGVQIESTIDHDVIRSIYFHDPDGNGIELYCDMVSNGFEFMRTMGPKNEPLDLGEGRSDR
jgi:catechol 2,3-dioxygenase